MRNILIAATLSCIATCSAYAGESAASQINVEPTANAIKKSAERGELASFTIMPGKEVKQSYVVVLDNNTKSRLLLTQILPRVRQQKASLVVIPTSLATGDDQFAAELLANSSYTYLNAWARGSGIFKASNIAKPTDLAKIAENNRLLKEVNLTSTPLVSFPAIKQQPGTAAYGLLPLYAFNLSTWPDYSWTKSQLAELRPIIGEQCPLNTRADAVCHSAVRLSLDEQTPIEASKVCNTKLPSETDCWAKTASRPLSLF